MAIILVTHDLGVVAESADDVAVMYAGSVVEQASVTALFAHPMHPYTAGLLHAIPRIDTTAATLAPIEGTVPSAINLPPGCSFAPRCPHAQPRCRQERPNLLRLDEGRVLACHFPLHATKAAA
jgi:oligopeptide/dipeptide ABC transporter ATP-binding protein